jgi:DNA-binding CsgD family transcriptional regulator
LTGDEAYLRWQAHYERQSVSPGGLRRVGAFVRDIDVRRVLPTVRVPTLVLHRTNDRFLSVEAARYVAAAIPAARLVELPGDDHFCHVHADDWVPEVERFVRGSRPGSTSERFLTTVLSLASDALDVQRRGDSSDDDPVISALVADHGGAAQRGAPGTIVAWFDGPARAIGCGVELVNALRRGGWSARAGLHAGEVERLGDRIGGTALDIADQVAARAAPGEVLVSRTVRDLMVGTATRFEDRGSHQLSGTEESWQLLRVAATSNGTGGTGSSATAAGSDPLRERPSVAALTDRERLVLELLVAGRSNAEIAAALSISPRTAERHLENVYAKLGVHRRTEAVTYALRHGLLEAT